MPFAWSFKNECGHLNSQNSQKRENYSPLYVPIHGHLRRKWPSKSKPMLTPRLGARTLSRSTMVRYSRGNDLFMFSKTIDQRHRLSLGIRGPGAQRCAFLAAASFSSPHEMTATDIIQSIKLSKISASDISKHFLERIERYDPDLNCYLHVNAAEVIQQVRSVFFFDLFYPCIIGCT